MPDEMDYLDEVHVTPFVMVRATFAPDGTAKVTVTGGRWDGYEKAGVTWAQARGVRDVMVQRCREAVGG